ncbi:MAG: tetratricopeptide repeat protein [Phycisphaera sp.]|nr:tetratricopeptide repeat protein [Phycisphaera sp.]
MSEHTTSQSCTPAGRKVSLTVLGDGAAKARPHSRMGHWRAAVLIGIHLLILAHIVQWLVAGSTVSPVEPSESMQTLELGKVNAGFIFFVVAILATLIFGRYFCGWGCHIVALQDLCTWMMNKIGVRPKPFRARLLAWAPLGFGLYMFVWPTFKRVALLPLLEVFGVERPVWLRDVAEFHGFASELIVDDFWATFPQQWYVIIPFFLVVGFGAVYFLGSKGFCTYGCPYGGIFGVVDKISPGRIVVNNNCHSCGHCTAVCTSNVRVHEEIRDFGMVMDPGCMKCMDCISACPNDALSFAFTSPSVMRKPVNDEAKSRQAKVRHNPKRFDLSWPEEIVGAVVFVAMFLAYRGMFNLVPMLMAAGMAGIGTFVVWKGWSLLSKPNVRIQSIVLKAKGRYKVVGVVSLLLALLVACSAVWSGGVISLRAAARLTHERLDVPIDIVLRPEYAPTQKNAQLAQSGIRRFMYSERYGWTLNPEQRRELAYMSLIAGEREHAKKLLRQIVESGEPSEELVRQYLALMTALGADQSEQYEAISSAFERHPRLVGLLPDIALKAVQLAEGSTQNAEELWTRVIEAQPESQRVRLQAAEFDIAIGQPSRAIERLPYFESMTDLEAGVVGVRVLLKLGRRDEAAALLDRLTSESADAGNATSRILSSLWGVLGQPDRAREVLEEFRERSPDSPGAYEALGQLALAEGDSARAADDFKDAIRLADGDAWVLLSLGESITISGIQTNSNIIRDIGLEALERAASLKPDSPLILRDLGMAYASCGQLEQGLQKLEIASALAPTNSAIQRDLAILHQRHRD